MSDTKKPSDDDAGNELSEDQLENVAGGRGFAGPPPPTKLSYDWVDGDGSTGTPKK
jgi:hypothetical protein